MQEKNEKTAFLFIVGVFIVLASIFSINQVLADTSSGNVSINNAAPTVGTVELLDSDAGTIQLTAASDTNSITCNATLTDNNGYSDIDSANATFFHSTSSHTASDDKNVHYKNTSCALTGGSGVNVLATCSINFEHEATNGTWSCNMTIGDGSALGSNIDTNTIDTLAALEVTEGEINFGSLSLGANSSSAQNITVINDGNIQIDSRFSGTNYTCGIGSIAVGNTRYNVTAGDYDNMSTDLTESAVTQTDFDLGIEGVATSEDTNSTKNEFWTIKIPTTGVGGSCNDTITVVAIAG